MTRKQVLSAPDIKRLAAVDTCTVSNAVELLGSRLRNEGFISRAVHCRLPRLSPLVGYAATARIRSSSAPVNQRCYYDRMDWWTYVASIREPRVMVLEDVDVQPGFGAFVGEIHAAIGGALNCVGCVTNGAVRDLKAAEALQFRLFSGSVSVSHAYAHIVEFGEPVEIGGLTIRSGDLVHGDRHGVLTIPLEVAARVPEEAARILRKERELVQFCASPQFTLKGLSERFSRERANGDQG